MAQDRTADLEASLLQGARGVQNNTENMLERLAKTFKPIDLVTIRNVLPEPFGWVYTDPSETVITQPDSATRRVEYGKPRASSLDVDGTKTIPGWQAYIALERMWKAYAQLEIEKISFVLTSAQEMDGFLSKAFLGVFDPDSVGGAQRDTLGFEPAPVVNTPVNRAAAAEAIVASQPPAPVPPVEDENLGFSDEVEQVQTPPVIPPLQDANQLTPGFDPNNQQNQ